MRVSENEINSDHFFSSFYLVIFIYEITVFLKIKREINRTESLIEATLRHFYGD